MGVSGRQGRARRNAGAGARPRTGRGAGNCGAQSERDHAVRVRYPGKDQIELIFLRVAEYTGEPRNLIFHDLRWEAGTLANFDFVEGDRDFLRGLYTDAYGD